MNYPIVAAVLLSGCGGVSMVGNGLNDQTIDEIQYSVTSPYLLSGSSPSGSDGFVYSVLPAAPLASDPWHLLFCYQSMCFSLSQPLGFIPTGEVNSPLQGNGKLEASGNLTCPGWADNSRITWYDGTPLHWHVAIHATCSDSSFSIVGDWRRL